MFSVMKCTGTSVRVFQTDIATLDEARKIASRMQELAPNKEIKYLVRERHRRGTKKLRTKTNSNLPVSPAPSNPSRISQQNRHTGGRYRVIRVQGNWEQYVKGTFQSEDEACAYALSLQRKTPDPSITYQVEYIPSSVVNASKPQIRQTYKLQSPRSEVKSSSRENGTFGVIRDRYGEKELIKGGLQTENEAYEYGLKLLRKTSDRNIQYYVQYTRSKRHVTLVPIRERPSKQQTQPEQQKSMAKRKRDYHRRSHDWNTNNRTRDAFVPYYSGELLGLGIPAQTGHGRRSRRWFNDF